MTNVKPKVFLIVDNPLRDLQGLALLSYQMAHRGFEAYLVPMYEQFVASAIIRPDIIILNYARFANTPYCLWCKSMGIKLMVLDTEGGVFDNIQNDFVDRIPRSLAQHVDRYITWGDVQRKAIIDQGLFAEDEIVATGCPRYDFCAQPWRKALEKKGKGKFILINMRYGLLFPRYAKDTVSEIEKPFRKEIVSIHWCWRFINSMKGCVSIFESIEYLTKAFPDLEIIVRPHPFERDDIYKIVFEDMPNVKVIREGFSLEWINSALAVIQKECSTAVESKLLNVPVLSINWLGETFTGSEATYKVAHPINNPQELIDIIRALREGRADIKNHEIDTMIYDYFGALDGQASERVCSEVESVLASEKKNIPINFSVRFFAWNNIIKTFIRKFLGRKIIQWIRKLKGGRDNSSKYFSKEWVERIMVRIKNADPDGKPVEITSSVFRFFIKIVT
ncbi:MAG: hypothetical protein PHY73_05840 [Candidatus Omnitrophica bacterium]|nr:hypothetical protein [Candidatus Omnitrophota bacterium]